MRNVDLSALNWSSNLKACVRQLQFVRHISYQRVTTFSLRLTWQTVFVAAFCLTHKSTCSDSQLKPRGDKRRRAGFSWRGMRSIVIQLLAVQKTAVEPVWRHHVLMVNVIPKACEGISREAGVISPSVMTEDFVSTQQSFSQAEAQ